MTEAQSMFLDAYDSTLNETSAIDSAGIDIDTLAAWKKDDKEFTAELQKVIKKHHDALLSGILRDPKTVQDKKLAMQVFEQMLGRQYKRAKAPGKHSGNQTGEEKQEWIESRKPV